MDKISLSVKFTRFDEHWSPKLIDELNGQYVKLAKGKGELSGTRPARRTSFSW